MKYRRLGSVFLLLLMIRFCLYGNRLSIAERIAPATAEQPDISGEPSYSEESEYEYNMEEIECGQGQTARIERFFYPDENRAEVSVDSELLNYMAKLQSRESDESADTLILTMDVEIAQDGNTTKSQQITWTYADDLYDYSTFNGAEAVDLICPNFQDVNRDGYLDFLVLNYFTSREGWHTIFVWDTESEEYV